MRKPPIIQPLQIGENARVDVQRDLSGGALIVIREGNQIKSVRITRESAIGMGLALIEAGGVTIEEVYRRQQALKLVRTA